MQLSKFTLNIYLLAIFSSFFPFAAYIPIFLGCFILFLFDLILNRKTLKKNVVFIVWVICLFCVSIVSHLINLNTSDAAQFIKLLINFSFISGFYFFISNHRNILEKNKYKIKLLIELIIFLTFLQVILNVYIMNLWFMPFTGVQNSIDAYLIINPPIYFGTKEKNIWATKFVFLSIIYLTCYIYHIFNGTRKLYTFLGMILFVVLYTFSRTAQLMFIAFVFLYYFWKIFYIQRNIVLQAILFLSLILFSIPVGIIIFNKLLHITLGSGDGLAARFELWNALYLHLEKMNIWFGNGFLSAQYIISTYTNWDNNNFHNVFMNLFSDIGMLGLFIYLIIVKFAFSCHNLIKCDSRFVFLCLFFPFFICINSQYLGFDSDIVIYFSLVMLFIQSRSYGA